MKKKKPKSGHWGKVARKIKEKRLAGSSAGTSRGRQPGRGLKVVKKTTVKVDKGSTLKASNSPVDPVHTPLMLKAVRPDLWESQKQAAADLAKVLPPALREAAADLLAGPRPGRYVIAVWVGGMLQFLSKLETHHPYKMGEKRPAEARRWNSRQAAHKYLNGQKSKLEDWCNEAFVMHLDEFLFKGD